MRPTLANCPHCLNCTLVSGGGCQRRISGATSNKRLHFPVPGHRSFVVTTEPCPCKLLCSECASKTREGWSRYLRPIERAPCSWADCFCVTRTAPRRTNNFPLRTHQPALLPSQSTQPQTRRRLHAPTRRKRK